MLRDLGGRGQLHGSHKLILEHSFVLSQNIHVIPLENLAIRCVISFTVLAGRYKFGMCTSHSCLQVHFEMYARVERETALCVSVCVCTCISFAVAA